MGMDRTIAVTGDIRWDAIQSAASSVEIPLTVRMIDGLPAFPNEIPGQGWNEVRISTNNGMITLRRVATGLSLVVWGNADASLQSDWEKLCASIELALNEQR